MIKDLLSAVIYRRNRVLFITVHVSNQIQLNSIIKTKIFIIIIPIIL